MQFFCRVIGIFLLTLSWSKYTQAEYFEECDGMEEGTFVASRESCQMYIYCDGEDSVAAECDDGEYFDGESCDAAENVYCPLDDPDYSEEPGSEEYPDESEEPEETTTKRPTTTTTPTTTQQPTTPGTNETTTFEAITVAPIVRDSCPDEDDPNQLVLMTNIHSCSDYYLCYHGNPIAMHCTNDLHFNMHTGKCDFPDKVQCMIDRPQANKCLPNVTDFFPHPDKCNYFYYCIKGFLSVQQCPFYYGWDIERRACVQISQAKCMPGSKKK